MLTDSQWDHRTVLDQVALEADQWLGGTADSCLLFDESGFTKKGIHSVGVQRQWCVRQGKVDNCQVGVFAALGKGHLSSLIDERLYLPKEWSSNPALCRKADIPEAERNYRSKSELALEIARHQKALGLRYAWVGADGGYRKEPAFLGGLEAMGEVFVVDIHKDQQIYLEDPRPIIPESTTTRGRPRSRRQAQTVQLRVDQWINAQQYTDWQRVTLRDSSKGKLQVEIVHQRFWIERSLQDGKSESGLADYQARKWWSWHHHMALVMMVILFMLEERILQKDDHPLLS